MSRSAVTPAAQSSIPMPTAWCNLNLLHQHSVLHSCSLVGYCLMSNHVHLIAVPGRANSLPIVLRDAHGRYATYLNGRQGASGHVWQGRYYSCPLDRAQLWTALRYVESNPVRARMVARSDIQMVERWGALWRHGRVRAAGSRSLRVAARMGLGRGGHSGYDHGGARRDGVGAMASGHGATEAGAVPDPAAGCAPCPAPATSYFAGLRLSVISRTRSD